MKKLNIFLFSLSWLMCPLSVWCMEGDRGALRKQSSGLQIYLPSHQISLHRAASQKDIRELQRSLSEEESDLFVNVLSGSGEGPLHTAVEASNKEGVLLLLARGANPRLQRTADGWTVFHMLACSGNTELAKAIMIKACFPFTGRAIAQAKQEVITAADDVRGALLAKKATALKELHVKQLQAALQVEDSNGKTCALIAEESEKCPEPNIFASKTVEELLGEEVVDRYVTDITISVTKVLTDSED